MPGDLPVRWPDAYVGLRFRDGGRARPAVDCWGLVRLVLMECCGIEVPGYGDVAAADLMAVALRISAQSAVDPWTPVTAPRAFDVATMTGRHRSAGGSHLVVAHVGVVVDAGRLLHIEAASGAVVVPLDHPTIRPRLRGFFRHRVLAEAA